MRVAGPASFGVEHLAAALAQFAAAHPRIELDIAFEYRMIDLIGEEFDLGVRIGKLAESSLVARGQDE